MCVCVCTRVWKMAPKKNVERGSSRGATAKKKAKAKGVAVGRVASPSVASAASPKGPTAAAKASGEDPHGTATAEAPAAPAEAEGAPVAGPEAAGLQAKVKAKLPVAESGLVVLRYSMYNESFQVTEGKLCAGAIDEVYCLSDVMPGCEIHVSAVSPEQKYVLVSAGEEIPYIFEDPLGTFHGLRLDQEYFVYVTEDEAEFLKSQERGNNVAQSKVDIASRDAAHMLIDKCFVEWCR